MLLEVLNETLNFIDWNYSANKQIADSGQRIVFKGKANSTSNDCVIKLSRYSDPVSISRYQREMKIMKDLDSNYFPKIYDHTFCSKETLSDLKDFLIEGNKKEIKDFIEMNSIRSFYLNTEQYIEHLSWSAFIEELTSNENTFKNFFKECFLALDILWKKKIVHRDLKPDNILITATDKKPVIIDLGIAKSLNDGTQNLTVGQTPCTYQFASPEQVLNNTEQIDYKSDQFSMGVLMFFVLTGDFPYGEINDSDFLVNINSGSYKNLNDYDITISDDIKTFIHRLLEHLPHKRYRKTETILGHLG